MDDRSGRWSALVDEHGPALAGLSAALCGNRDDAEDVLADTLVTLWRKWALVDAADHPRAYARRVLVSTYLALCRRNRRHRAVTARLASYPEEPTVDATDVVARRDLISRHLNTLPAKERTAIVLRYFADLPTERIADELRTSPAAARTYLSRGLAHLKASISTEQELTP